MNRELILRVADVIECGSVPNLGFDMSHFCLSDECGTTACMAGWTVAVAEQVDGRQLPELDVDIAEYAADLLGVTYRQSLVLFLEEQSATRAQAAAVLRILAETGVVDWKRARRTAAERPVQGSLF